MLDHRHRGVRAVPLRRGLSRRCRCRLPHPCCSSSSSRASPSLVGALLAPQPRPSPHYRQGGGSPSPRRLPPSPPRHQPEEPPADTRFTCVPSPGTGVGRRAAAGFHGSCGCGCAIRGTRPSMSARSPRGAARSGDRRGRCCACGRIDRAARTHPCRCCATKPETLWPGAHRRVHDAVQTEALVAQSRLRRTPDHHDDHPRHAGSDHHRCRLGIGPSGRAWLPSTVRLRVRVRRPRPPARAGLGSACGNSASSLHVVGDGRVGSGRRGAVDGDGHSACRALPAWARNGRGGGHRDGRPGSHGHHGGTQVAEDGVVVDRSALGARAGQRQPALPFKASR